jgi:hypothetical protein
VADARQGWDVLASRLLRRDSVALVTAAQALLGAGGGLGVPLLLSVRSIIGILDGLRDPLCFFQECSARLRRSQTLSYLSVKRLNVESRPSGEGELEY